MACVHTTSGAHRGDHTASASHKLEETREPPSNIQDLKVDPELQEYTEPLSNALESQLAAEAKEIQFYEMLEQDPALSGEPERRSAHPGRLRGASPKLLKKG